MRWRTAFAVLLGLSISLPAVAIAAGSAPIHLEVNGLPISTANPLPSGTVSAGSATVTAYTAGTSSAQALGAATARVSLLAIDNESPTASIAVSFGGTAALNTAGSFTIGPGQTRTWNAGFAPMRAIDIIASVASTPVTIEREPVE